MFLVALEITILLPNWADFFERIKFWPKWLNLVLVLFCNQSIIDAPTLFLGVDTHYYIKTARLDWNLDK